MTTIDLYRKHKAGEVSREKFLYEVRRDNNLPFITNLTSYDDAVKILKNRGIVTESDTKEAKADEAVKAEVKPKKATEPKLKELHIDQANPYEYRHGLAHELHQLGEYTDEALEKAKTTVLKNLAKDANFYSNLLNQQQSHYEFKTPESQDEKLSKKLDSGGRMEIKGFKNEKANVKDNLGKKEEGTTKPKGVKIMPDKGVTGSEKTIKEGFQGQFYAPEYLENKYGKETAKKIEAEIDDLDPNSYDRYTGMESAEEVEDYIADIKDMLNIKEGSFMGGADLGSSLDQGNSSIEQQLEKALRFHDWYYQYSDDSRAWQKGQDEKNEISSLMKQLPREKAVELYNKYCPKDWKLQNEDKHTKIKEALKQGLKELINPKDIQAAKTTGDVVNIPVQDLAAQTAAKNAKINFRTYK